jgi:hypothetical protein
MARYTYNRDAVPVGEELRLDVQFTDVAGTQKDADTNPSLVIFDAAGVQVRELSASDIEWIGTGLYRYELTVPDGYTSGVWTDVWSGSVDGYALGATFNFTVNSAGSITAVGTVVDPVIEIGDEPWPSLVEFSQQAKANINVLLKMLKSRLRSTAFKPDGTKCDVFSTEDLFQFLCIALSELNLTPTITGYTFDDMITRSLFADILTQGAMLQAWSGQAILESGREFSINDNGVALQPPPVSSTISSFFNMHLSDYRAKLREAKHNIRPAPLGISAGSLFGRNPQVLRLTHLKDKRIL